MKSLYKAQLPPKTWLSICINTAVSSTVPPAGSVLKSFQEPEPVAKELNTTPSPKLDSIGLDTKIHLLVVFL